MNLKAVVVFLWRLWMILLGIIYVVVFALVVIIPLVISEKAFPYVYPIIRNFGRVLFYGMGFRLDYEEQVTLDPKERYVFIANHTSLMDIMTMLTV